MSIMQICDNVTLTESVQNIKTPAVLFLNTYEILESSLNFCSSTDVLYTTTLEYSLFAGLSLIHYS